MPYIGENTAESGRVRARTPPDRRLIDAHNFVDVLNPLDAVVRKRVLQRMIELLGQKRLQSAVDKRRLAASRHTRHNNQLPKWNRYINVFQIITPATMKYQFMTVARSALRRHRNAQFIPQICSRHCICLFQFIRRARKHKISATLSCSRAEVNDIVGRKHHIAVVLDHNHGVSLVTQCLESGNKSLIITIMQSDTWFIKNIEDIYQLRTNLGCKPYALTFTTRQSCRRTVERKVVQSHVQQELKSGTDFLQNLGRNTLLFVCQMLWQLLEPFVKFADIHLAKVGYVLVVQTEPQRLLLQARPLTLRAHTG